LEFNQSEERKFSIRFSEFFASIGQNPIQSQSLVAAFSSGESSLLASAWFSDWIIGF